MPVPNVTVSLSEVLEVRGSPLTETEIWALLCLGAEALQDGFISGKQLLILYKLLYPGIYADGYIVFVFPFIRSYVSYFVIPER